MKKTLVILSTLALVPAISQAALIAYWNFDTGTPSEDIIDQQIIANYNASSTTAVIDVSGFGGNSYIQNHSNDATNGIGDGWNRIDAYAGTTNRQLAFAGGATGNPLSHNANNTWVDFTFSAANFEDIEVTLGQRGQGNATSGSARTGLWQYSIDGTNFTTIGGEYSNGTTTTPYDAGHADFSHGNGWRGHRLVLPEEVNGAEQVTLRLVFTLIPPESVANPLRIDNVQINGTSIPEPGTVLFGSLGALALLRRRR